VGFKHGSYCVGCCWAVMAVMFVVGAMNLIWMAALTVFMLGEKVAPARWRVRELSGVALVLWGLAVGISLVR
jgi:predicted metal-binding membrane protein